MITIWIQTGEINLINLIVSLMILSPSFRRIILTCHLESMHPMLIQITMQVCNNISHQGITRVEQICQMIISIIKKVLNVAQIKLIEVIILINL